MQNMKKNKLKYQLQDEREKRSKLQENQNMIKQGLKTRKQNLSNKIIAFFEANGAVQLNRHNFGQRALVLAHQNLNYSPALNAE